MYVKEPEESALLRKNAQRIAVTVASAISYDVIITDPEGVVAGTSGALRTGVLHGVSRAVIFSGKIAETGEIEARRKEGGLAGVTAPISSVNGQIAGAVTIAGAPEKVRPFVRIVRQQVETLLRECELYACSIDRESALQNLAQDISSFVPGVNNESLLLSRAQEYGFDPAWRYVPVAVDLYQFGRFAMQAREAAQNQGWSAEARILDVRKAVLAAIRRNFPEARNLTAMSGNSRFLILYAAAGKDGAPENDNALAAEASRRAKKVLDEIGSLGLKSAAGVGSPALGMPPLAASCQEAWKALVLGKKFCRQPGVYNIEDFRLEDMITTLDAPVRARFVQVVTGRLRQLPDWEQARGSIRAWCESGFSLIEASRRLHVHRNTLIYRLGKLARETGLNLKDFRTCLNLYLALVMDQYAGPAAKEKEL